MRYTKSSFKHPMADWDRGTDTYSRQGKCFDSGTALDAPPFPYANMELVCWRPGRQSK